MGVHILPCADTSAIHYRASSDISEPIRATDLTQTGRESLVERGLEGLALM